MGERIGRILVISSEYLSIISKHYRIDKAIIFGSYSTGNTDANSDIDLAIVSSSLSGNSFRDNVELGKFTWGIDTRIEPIGFTPKDFDELIFAQEIKKNGIEIPLN